MRVLMSLMAALLLLWGGMVANALEPVKLGQHTVTLTPNVKQGRRSTKLARQALGAPLEGNYYVLVQFEAIPDAALQEKVKERGITLYDYVGANAYYARIPVHGMRRRLKRSGIQALTRVAGEWKLDDNIAKNDIPDYAKDGDLIKVQMVVWESFREDWVRSRLASMGVQVKDFHFAEAFWSVSMSVSQADVLKLAEEAWVKHVGLEAPPAELYEEGTTGASTPSEE